MCIIGVLVIVTCELLCADIYYGWHLLFCVPHLLVLDNCKLEVLLYSVFVYLNSVFIWCQLLCSYMRIRATAVTVLQIRCHWERVTGRPKIEPDDRGHQDNGRKVVERKMRGWVVRSRWKKPRRTKDCDEWAWRDSSLPRRLRSEAQRSAITPQAV